MTFFFIHNFLTHDAYIQVNVNELKFISHSDQHGDSYLFCSLLDSVLTFWNCLDEAIPISKRTIYFHAKITKLR